MGFDQNLPMEQVLTQTQANLFAISQATLFRVRTPTTEI